MINHYLVTIAANVEQTWRATSQCTVSDGGAPTAFETEAACIVGGTCNNFGSANSSDDNACMALFSDADDTVPAVWIPTNTWSNETVCEWSSTCGCSTCESFAPWASVGDVDLKST